MMINLETYVSAVWNAKTLQEKKTAMLNLIDISHAKADTKRKAVENVSKAYSMDQIDSYATNYMFSGEGNKVIK